MSSTPLIFLSVVSRHEGKVSPYTLTDMALLGGFAQQIRVHVMPTPHDLARTRSRVGSRVAVSDEYTHLLFWDDDVDTDGKPGRVISEMLAADVDIIFTPYPKKSMDLYAWREAPTIEDAQGDIYNWPIVFLAEESPRSRFSLQGDPRTFEAREVGMVGMGCTLIKKHVLKAMYDDSPEFLDSFGGVKSKPRAMFAMRHIGLQLLPEDCSFCWRARELGFRVWLNTASTTNHFGVHRYEGNLMRAKKEE